LNVIEAYRRVGTYRGAAEICGVTHKTVKRVVEKDQTQAERVERRKEYESVRDLVADELRETTRARSARSGSGYAGSDRNFRRLVSQERAKYRHGQAIVAGRARRSGRRVSTWSSTGASTKEGLP
jgi:hypothetical protein